MKNRKNRTGLRLLILLVLLLLALLGFAVGKYVTTIERTGTVEFTANLASEVILQEHKSNKQPDGSYILDDESIVTTNAYILIPGLDVPKDPYVIIKGKTAVPAYLFVEITSTLDAPVKYDIDDANWALLKTDGTKTVYYYKTVIGAGFPETAINILKDKQITVGQNLLHNYDDAEDLLTIRAILKEKVGSNTAGQTYDLNS